MALYSKLKGEGPCPRANLLLVICPRAAYPGAIQDSEAFLFVFVPNVYPLLFFFSLYSTACTVTVNI